MVQTVAVGTDGSGTASKAVEFAIDLAARYEAKIVFISAYVPVSESRLKREARDAPEDLQWTINPAEDVDATLRDCEERAEERGLRWASEAREGDAAKVARRAGREQRGRHPRDREQGHGAQGARQRAELRVAQRAVLRADRQDDLNESVALVAPVWLGCAGWRLRRRRDPHRKVLPWPSASPAVPCASCSPPSRRSRPPAWRVRRR